MTLTVQQTLSRTQVDFPATPLSRLQSVVIWLMLVSSFCVIVEPAPSDAIFGAVLLAFFRSGLKFRPAIAPMILFLLLYNLGGFLSFLQIAADSKARLFVITSCYMGVTAIFFATYLAEDTLRRAAIIRNAIIIAGVFASLFAIAGYLNIGGFVGGAPDFQSHVAAQNRAVGLFKDPNVFSTFVIFPALLLVQGFMLGEQRYKLLSALSLIIILAALFLAFSRGAWISFLASAMLLAGLTYILTPPSAIQMRAGAMRLRISLFVILGFMLCFAMLAVLLSFEQVRNLFLDRLTLIKDYDGGETGRFANQVNSIPMLLVRPLGFGPLQFGEIFRFAPHNVYVNAFSSYGWLGGISYFTLIVLTLQIGFKSVFTRTPWQSFAIVVFCPLVTTIFQGIQIDTDHWRHFYWLLGLTWGLFSANIGYAEKNRGSGRPVEPHAFEPLPSAR
jgi:hypothetical protein